MSCLDATFTLTPNAPWYWVSSTQQAMFRCYGADFLAGSSQSLSGMYAKDAFFFSSFTAADPSVNYKDFWKRIKVPFLDFYANLSAFGTTKSLALVFAFEAPWNPGRVLLYNDLGLISDQTLNVGDNQLLLEIDSLDSGFVLYFVHGGGDWHFKGLSGYVV